MKERWVFNKIGFVNYWWFVDETLEFSEDGNMLINGENASGKSITLAAIMPVILDGNTSPARLDPFSSKAKKMDYYVVGHDENRTDGTSYVYAELIKRDTGETKTLIMGLEAKKNGEGVKKTFFVVENGERVGKDISLFTEKDGSIIPEKVSNLKGLMMHSKIFTGPGDYARYVGQALFGFNEEEYKNFVKLLVLIRSVKLNNNDDIAEKISEKLKESLEEIDENVLDSVSNIYKHLDDIEKKMGEYEKDVTLVEKIAKAHGNYLVSLSKERYEYYSKSKDALEKTERELKNDDVELKRQVKIYDKKSIQLNKLRAEKNEAEKIRSIPENAKAVELEVELLELKKSKGEAENDISSYQNRLETAKDRIKEYESNHDDKEYENNEAERSIKANLESIAKNSTDIGFDQAALDPIRKNFYKKLDENSFKACIESNIEDASKVKDIMMNIELKREQMESYEEEIGNLSEEKSNSSVKLDKLNQSYLSQVHDYSGLINEWFKTNSHYGVGFEDDFKNLSGSVREATENGDFKYVEHILETSKVRAQSRYKEKALVCRKNRETLEGEIKKLEEEVFDLKRAKEIPLERTDSRKKHRVKLEEEKIYHSPLYNAVKFKDGVDERIRGIIESVLLETGHLDALLVSSDISSNILRNILDDEIILNFRGEENVLGYNLHNYVEAESYLPNDVRGALNAFLSSVGIYDTKNSDDVFESLDEDFVNLKGRFKIGTIAGVANPDYKALHIGLDSRKKKIKNKIAELKEVIREKEEEIDNIAGEVKAIEQHITELDNEFVSFPAFEELEDSYQTILKILEDIDGYDRQIESYKRNSLATQNQVRTLTQEWKTLLRGRFSAVTKNKDGMGFVLKNLRSIKFDTIELFHQQRSLIKGYDDVVRLKNSIRDIKENITSLEIDISRRVTKREKLDANIRAIEERIKTDEYKALRLKIEAAMKVLSEFDEKHEALIEEKTSAENKIVNIQKRMSDLTEQMSKLENEVVLRKVILTKTLELIDFNGEVGKIEEYLLSFNVKEGSLSLSDKLSEMVETYIPDLSIDYSWKTSGNKYMVDPSSLDGRLKEIAEGSIVKAITVRNPNRGENDIRISPHTLYDILKNNYEELKKDASRLEVELTETFLKDEISREVGNKYSKAKDWVNEIANELNGRTLAGGMKLELRMRFKGDTTSRKNYKKIVGYLSNMENSINPEYREVFMDFLKDKVDKEKEYLRREEEEIDYKQMFSKVLDYRQWIEFVIYMEKDGEAKQQLSKNTQGVLSGGQRATASYAPLFSAMHLTLQKAKEDALKVVGLDEAFAGVDGKNTDIMFDFLENLGFSYVLNSEKLDGLIDSISNISIYRYVKHEESKTIDIYKSYWSDNQHFDYEDISIASLIDEEALRL